MSRKRYAKCSKKQVKSCKIARSVSIKPEFSDKKLTNYAGMLVFGGFLKKLKFEKLLGKHLDVERGENARYNIYNFITMILTGILCGAEHTNHVSAIARDTVLQKIFSWAGAASESALCRFTNLLGWKHVTQMVAVIDDMRHKVWDKKWYGKAVLDLDSTVKTLYGHQEGAKKGYNPHKKGAKSVHPLLCFIAGTKEILHGWYRPGDVHTSHGVIEFIKECFAKLPKRVWKVFVRADSGFFSGDFLYCLEKRKASYLVKAKLKNMIQLLSSGERTWRKVRNSDEFDSTVFMYRCQDWSKARKFVALRKVKYIDNSGLFPLTIYDYFFYVTNLKLSPMAIHKLYGERATSENWIEQAKNQCAAGSFAKHSFWSSAFLFQLSILAYNLKIWMTLLTDKKAWKEEVKTFRFWFVKMAANLVRTGRGFILKLQKGNYYEDRWIYIHETVEAMSFY